MTTFDSPEMTPQYRVDALEFRDHALVISFTELDQYKGQPRIVDHTNREIVPGADDELDERIAQLHQDACEILNLAHTVKRNPPLTRPAGRRPAPSAT